MRWGLGRIRARMILGYWFAAAFLGRLMFWRRRLIRETLLARYGADGIFATSENERAKFPGFQKCVACSLCTFSCAAIREGRAPSSFEPKYVLLAYGRSAADSAVFRKEWLPCSECNACTIECPSDVPLHQLIELVLLRRTERTI